MASGYGTGVETLLETPKLEVRTLNVGSRKELVFFWIQHSAF